jgi:hypothetical protein
MIVGGRDQPVDLSVNLAGDLGEGREHGLILRVSVRDDEGVLAMCSR